MQASRGAQHIVARYTQAQPEQLPLLPTIIRTIGHSVAILRTHPVTSQVMGLPHENERHTSLALVRSRTPPLADIPNWRAMSAFGGKADMTLRSTPRQAREKHRSNHRRGDVRFWPKADISSCAAHVRYWV
jgi:hypothetical protein